MKKFEAPVITEMNSLNIEPVYAASGVLTPHTPNHTTTTNNDFECKCEWCNHNSGSHSEIKVKIHNNGKQSGDNIHMDFFITDFKLVELTPGDSCLIASNLYEHGFSLSRVGRHFNPGENIEFVMQLTCKKDNEKVGAYGTSGVYSACNVYCTGLTVS